LAIFSNIQSFASLFSPFNPDAPLVEKEMIPELRRDTLVQQNVLKSFRTMLQFYGFKLEYRQAESEVSSSASSSPVVDESRKSCDSDSSDHDSDDSDAKANEPSPDAPLAASSSSPQSSSPAALRPVLIPNPNIRERAPNSWACKMDHNHLRITRIMKSLHIFGLHAEARAFFETLSSHVASGHAPVNQRTLGFWKEAYDYDPLK
jgi:hypothetical protein